MIIIPFLKFMKAKHKKFSRARQCGMQKDKIKEYHEVVAMRKIKERLKAETRKFQSPAAAGSTGG
jgi:hypothetical protein